MFFSLSPPFLTPGMECLTVELVDEAFSPEFSLERKKKKKKALRSESWMGQRERLIWGGDVGLDWVGRV